MRWALNGSVAMNGREREGWEGVERLQEGSKGLSYTDEWALAGNHRVASLSNESEDATRKESTSSGNMRTRIRTQQSQHLYARASHPARPFTVITNYYVIGDNQSQVHMKK